jgi:hypothetical protein
MTRWTMLHPNMTPEHLGFLPAMLSEANPASAREQLDSGYRQHGGWTPFKGFHLAADNSLLYPGDPPQKPIAATTLRDELILLYESDWVAIIQPDRSFEVARMT